MDEHHIRRATLSDADVLADLTLELGYPASPDSIRHRLGRILESANDCLMVAELANGGVGGWIHGILGQLLESEYRVEIGGLVVGSRWRRLGIGAGLVRAIEAWGRSRGALELSVRCRQERSESHAFYERMAFRRTKVQHVFRKRLEPG